ncbi:hypothetical protein CDL12_18479 [Handroanthus impetiginosus]|uniref:Gibberellin regulated protein n=1 Tax=Handroanthus impetiginosus TaxID=429701 RepID=A0A2G9GUH7_9LAMI|nr:hypothetical protein CDL12_26976 [Handroanthus impetiginosus]PIN08933.1 hypothetical protein CDL12_18480 [Handroanthus impetiginosus]PIN08944.1 hypothetical protein CDL12_18479 [Handroanthus impetiginosus]
MAISKHIIITSLFISLLLLHPLVQAIDQEMTSNNRGGSSFAPKMNCGVACEARCRLSSRQNLCKRACGTCCSRCNCVPPGTSGNQELCPCYYTMTTHGGRRKCP